MTLLELSDQVGASRPRNGQYAASKLVEKGRFTPEYRIGRSDRAGDPTPEPEATGEYDKQIEHTNTLELMLSTGEMLKTGLVVLAIGVKPETMLANQAGIELGARGGIKVDARMYF